MSVISATGVPIHDGADRIDRPIVPWEHKKMKSACLCVSRVLHAGYLFEHEDTRILFDPIFENPFSVNCHAFPQTEFDVEAIRGQRFSAVLISHYHDDHCSLESLNLLSRETPIYVYCVHEELFGMIRDLGFTQVHPLTLDRSVRVGPFEITARRALDEDVDSIFQIRVGEINILNVVDSWIGETTMDLLEKSAPWDLVLWPFQTMRELEVLSPHGSHRARPEVPGEWKEQLRRLRPKCLVPSSCQFKLEPWSWYNRAFFPISYAFFEKEIKNILPKTRLIRLDPSRSIFLDPNGVCPAPSLSWVRLIGAEGADYEFEPEARPPSVAEISRRFRALSASQAREVSDYCHHGLIERFAALESSTEPFFSAPRRWRLSVYDELGAPAHYDYKVRGHRLEMASPGGFDWLTEISATKLHGALFEGETLTSLYLRINDAEFGPEKEKEHREADILEDPLIRCLYTGSIGSFQRAQLRRLLQAVT